MPLPRIVLACLLFTASLASAPPTPQRTLLALSKQDHTLAAVDPASLKVLFRAPVGPDPHEVIASADGRTAYVSIYGGGRYHAISVIDLVAGKALPDIETGALTGPHGLDFTGGKLWFTAEGAKAIARFDPASQKIDWIMGTGQNRTHMLIVSADQRHIYTTNVASSTVTVLDQVTLPPPGTPPPPPGQPNQSGPPPGMNPPPAQPRLDWSETVIPVGKGAEGFDLTPDGRFLWTANAQDGTLSILDLAAGRVVQTLDAKLFGANRLKITPDGRYALISSLRNGDLVLNDVSARSEFKRIPIGHGAAGILIDRPGNRAFVACTPDNYVAIIDLASFTVTGRLDVGPQPDGLAWAIRP